MSYTRRAASALLGLALAAASLKIAACSAIDPVPPDPHEEDSDANTAGALRNAVDASDASEDAPRPLFQIIDPTPENPH